MNSGVDSGAGVVLALLFLVLAVAVYAWVALALAATFRKMGEEPWRGWVPFLNVATILVWGGFSPWLVLVALVPILGPVLVAVLVVVSVHRINPGFGYGTGLTVLAAFLFPVWATIVGFGPAQWRGARRATVRPPAGASPPYAPFVAGGFGAPLPPPPLPTAVADTTASDARADAAPAPAAVAPQPWAPTAASFAPGAAASVQEDPVPEPRPVAHQPAADAAGDFSAAASSGDVAPTRRGTADWQSEVDEVSAVSPAPFPPSAAGGGRPYVSPPVAASDEGIISSVPGRSEDAPVTRLRPPVVPTADRDERDVFPELTGEVSAVVGSPAAGSPVAASRSVSAQEREQREQAADPPELDEELDEELDRTVMVRRDRTRWELVPPAGSPIALTADVVIVGRNPAPDPGHPRAQLVAIVDPTRTVSKTHARLERRGDGWHIADLGSTNGVLLPSLLGTDIEVEPGTDAEVAERFLLGDASLRIQRADAGA